MRQVWKRFELWIGILAIILLIVLDQVTKSLAVSYLKGARAVSLIQVYLNYLIWRIREQLLAFCRGRRLFCNFNGSGAGYIVFPVFSDSAGETLQVSASSSGSVYFRGCREFY